MLQAIYSKHFWREDVMRSAGQLNPRKNTLPELDEGAQKRLVSAYLSDERPSWSVLTKRFGRSRETLGAILERRGVTLATTSSSRLSEARS
jgi:hypothetical protein